MSLTDQLPLDVFISNLDRFEMFTFRVSLRETIDYRLFVKIMH